MILLSHLMVRALLRVARLRSGRLSVVAVTKPSVRGQRYRLFRGRAHRRFRVLFVVVIVVVVTDVPVVVELLFFVVVFGFAHRPLSAVRLATVLARTAALAVAVHVPVAVARVHVRGTCKQHRP